MNSNQLSWTAFLVAIAGVTSASAQAATVDHHGSGQGTTIESRIARINSSLKNTAAKANSLENSPENASQSPETPMQVAIGWGNGRGGGTFVNLGRGGWGNGRGGAGFGNINPWRNGWGDRGGFYNRRWPDGGGFINRW
ncbi:rSAM-associated Gly-rich repeat protein [Synechocystis sp. B12]|uniref:GrrA/OscA1 family cyclophane-containing rSAM-modified RiPP n=1 Tax=Synechocystis sp. CACIAM 05 TaxID=1933929 RepID=UPI00138E5A9E|nr:GrrA/OscA1 family cyclophane-containing rSAM-modified RiPP [Synechocystis sp. CACIAM 05]QHU99712.1 rSAM-associated Gly-rich repeat protein [Synechocystis sp. CACIAM 05]WLT36982.1 rSAM-associated Gly-rich repeat protein [Synechocystis sp. B12]